MKNCPNCQERLKDDAILCTHCGHQFVPIPGIAKSGFRPTPNARKFGCAILVLAAFTLGLWVLTSRYLAESPDAANAVNASAAPGAPEPSP